MTDLLRGTLETQRAPFHALRLAWLRFFCAHQWAVIDKTVMESAFEQHEKTRAGNKFTADTTLLMFKKKVLLVCGCSICGKLQRFTETNP
jgi:hypothetical protein|tara:strand:+ start:577 stop:846 length:270 start_codon:yes stop_codon:yes gene_type:complete